jgi:hypothetical protein
MRAASDFIMEREARRVAKTVVGDKSPNSEMNGESVRLLSAIYPDARLLFIVRDGRDTAVSHRFQSFIDLVDTLSTEDLDIREAFLQDSGPFLRKERSLFTRRGLKRIAESWVKNITETNTAAKSLFGEKYLCLRYEDLLHNAIEVMNEVWEFLKVSGVNSELQQAIDLEMKNNPDKDWQIHKEQKIANNLRKGDPGSWREIFTNENSRLFKEIAGKELITWNYERNFDW